MPKFCANLTFLFQELPYLDRFGAAAEAGFDGVEVLYPYEVAAKETRRSVLTHGLELVLINAPPPNYTGGDPGFAALPGGAARFRHDFKRALRYAQTLHAERIHIMAGTAEGAEAHATFIENLRWAAAEAPAQQLTIEPINPHDMPGYFLNDFDQAADILDAVGADNLALQFDAYHAQRITGDMPGCWARHGHRAVHVQIAGHPGRHEPSGGEIDYPAFFDRLDGDGFRGWVSAEYHPATTTAAGLDWLPRNA